MCAYVQVAPCSGPLAVASLNISLMSNIICFIRLNKPRSYTYSHTVSDRDPNSVRKTCVTCSQQEDEIKAALCKFTVSHMSTQRIHNDRLIFTQTHRTHIFLWQVGYRWNYLVVCIYYRDYFFVYAACESSLRSTLCGWKWRQFRNLTVNAAVPHRDTWLASPVC